MNAPIDVEGIALRAARASALLGAMCNETRLMMLCQLVDGERSVTQLTEHLGAPQSTVSQHLGVLRRSGLVAARRDGQSLYYSLAGDEARAILETLQKLYCQPQPVDA